MKLLLARPALLIIALATVATIACRSPNGCFGNGPSAPCPIIPDAWAIVEGVVTKNGTPVQGIHVFVGCPLDPIGPAPLVERNSRASDDAGRYRVLLGLQTAGRQPLEWTAAGTATMVCRVQPSLYLADTASVAFYRQQEQVVATAVNVRVVDP